MNKIRTKSLIFFSTNPFFGIVNETFAVNTKRRAVSKSKNRLKNTNAKLGEVLFSSFLLKNMISLIGQVLLY